MLSVSDAYARILKPFYLHDATSLILRPGKYACIITGTPLPTGEDAVAIVVSDGYASCLHAMGTDECDHSAAHLTSHLGTGNNFSLFLENALLIVPSRVKSLPATSEAEIWRIE
jgi:hypothetical protein